MPKLPLPPEVDRLLRKANPAVIATLREGRLAAYGGHLVRLGRRARARQHGLDARAPEAHAPRPARVPDGDGRAGWYQQVTLFGRAVEIRDDPEFKDIDRLSLRYTRRQFNNRLGRGSAR